MGGRDFPDHEETMGGLKRERGPGPFTATVSEED